MAATERRRIFIHLMVRMKCRLKCLFSFALILVSFFIIGACIQARAQSITDVPWYASKNSFGVFSAFSNDSSHILIGAAQRRKLLQVGFGYDRRLFLNHSLNWQYSVELLPVALESDPLTGWVTTQSAPNVETTSGILPVAPVLCSDSTISYAVISSGVIYSGNTAFFCAGRRWTMGYAASPIGFRWSFLPGRRLQPFVVAHGGCMYSTRQIPADDTESFNFTFDAGGGIEIYRNQARSVRIEYRLHHISNTGRGLQNPGIDSGVLQVTYAFRLGRQ